MTHKKPSCASHVTRRNIPRQSLRYKQVSASGFPRHPLLSYFYVIEITARAQRVKPGLHFESKSTAYTQTILRTWGAFSQVPSVDTPTIRRLLSVDTGLSLVNSPQPLRIRKLLRDI